MEKAGRWSGLVAWKLLACSVFTLAFHLSAKAQAANNSLPPSHLSVSSPLDYQVFQRQTRLRGTMVLSGHVAVPADHLQVRIVGKSLLGPLPGRWNGISFDRKTGDFNVMLPAVAGGFYEVDIKALDRSHEVANAVVPHVGVGEVFVISGQSNSTNYGEVRQVTATGKVSTFSGESWRLANDPQPGVQDNSQKGSFIPSFGDALYRRYGVPIGVASVGHGSTSVRQWLPAGEPVELMPTKEIYVVRNKSGVLVSDGTLFNGMMARINQLGVHGFRAVLWHQGESDSHQPVGHDISGATYARMLRTVILTTRKQAAWDIPWFVAEATYHSPSDMSCPPIQAAQQSMWEGGIALQGPDTDTLTAQYRQENGKGVHFNDAGLKAHGALWAQAVEVYLDKVLR